MDFNLDFLKIKKEPAIVSNRVIKTNICSDGTKIERLESGVQIVHNGKVEKPQPQRRYEKQIYVENLCREDYDLLEKWMRPNQYSQSGFIGEKESLKDVIAKDNAYLRKQRITHWQISDGIKDIFRTITSTHEGSRPRHGCDITAETGIPYFVKSTHYCGWQMCPFEDLPPWQDVKQGKSDSDFQITNKNNNCTVFLSELHPHLIEYHHFFEGNTEYRLEPKQIIELLELKPL
jgi:hypothetical protein